MSNYQNTKATIAANVYTNHNNEVTAEMVKAGINAVVDTLIAGGFIYKGVATTSTNPGSPDANVFYIATAPGTYTNFGSLVVNDGEVAILKYNGSWSKEVTGAATAAEVTALGQKVNAIEVEMAGYKWEDVPYGNLINNYKVRASTVGDFIWDTNYKRTDYVPVTGGDLMRISVAQSTDATFKYGVAFYTSAKVYISGLTFPNEDSASNAVREITIPDNAAYLATCIYNTDSVIVCQKFIQGESYEEQFAGLHEDIDAVNERVDGAYDGPASFAEMLDIIQKFHDFRYVDVMPITSNSVAPLTKIGIFTPVSYTADTLTLSSADAACIDKTMALVCRTTDGHYYVGQFSAASSNVITLLYDYGVGIDLSTVDALMSIHDTIRNGNGQHLSPWGYKAMAERIAGQTQSKYWMANRVVTGFTTIDCDNPASWAVPDIVRTADQKLLCSPTYNSSWKTSGNTGIVGPSGTKPANRGGVVELSEKLGAWWTKKRYQCQQGVAGAKMQFPLPAFDRKVKGFVKVSCNCPIEGDFDGTAQLNVYGDGELIGYSAIPRFGDVVTIPVENFVSSVMVELEILENKNTQVNIGTFAFYENYSEDINPINADSIVAVAGSSNTQYPPANAPYISLVAGDPFNVLVTRPDGTTGDGYGYYPKELASVTGAVVDNWGKSGEKTTYGLSTIHGIFQTKRYSHLIMSYFGNDINTTGNTYKGLMKRVWELLEYSKNHGAIPVMVMSYGTSSDGQKANYGKFHEYLMLGVWYQYVSE